MIEKIICKLFVLLLLPVVIKAQTGKSIASYDTSYNNYLYDSRVEYFRGLPVSDGEIVFVGNSITHWGDWAELLGNHKVRNRGIAGDISYGVLARLDEILARKPKKIFLMIGVNDIGRGIPLQNTLGIYERILLKIISDSPSSRIFVQSVLPINDTLINRKYYTGTNTQISTMNKSLARLASKYNIPYIDLYTLFLDESGRQMKALFTYDGIHLSAKGYLLWTDYLKREGYCCY